MQGQVPAAAADDGVFPRFYEKLVGTPVPVKLKKLHIDRVLGYCSDITFEYEKVSGSNHRNASARVRLMAANNSAHAYAMMALPKARREVIKEFGSASKVFDKYFEEVALPKNSLVVFGLRENFDFGQGEIQQVEFYESRQLYDLNADGKVPVQTISQDVYSAVKPFFMSSVMKNEGDFVLSAPLLKRSAISFNEILAIYCVMFYLGSLVRYNPRYLDATFSSKYGWLIERFTKSTPLTFLRHIGNLIEHHDRVFYVR